MARVVREWTAFRRHLEHGIAKPEMCSYLKRQESQPSHPGTMPAPCHTLAALLVKEGQDKRHKYDERKKLKGAFLSCQGA